MRVRMPDFDRELESLEENIVKDQSARFTKELEDTIERLEAGPSQREIQRAKKSVMGSSFWMGTKIATDGVIDYEMIELRQSTAHYYRKALELYTETDVVGLGKVVVSTETAYLVFHTVESAIKFCDAFSTYCMDHPTDNDETECFTLQVPCTNFPLASWVYEAKAANELQWSQGQLRCEDETMIMAKSSLADQFDFDPDLSEPVPHPNDI